MILMLELKSRRGPRETCGRNRVFPTRRRQQRQRIWIRLAHRSSHQTGLSEALLNPAIRVHQLATLPRRLGVVRVASIIRVVTIAS